jgi:hypothetical protein
MSQGNSLFAIINKQKSLFFKNGEQEGKTGPVWGLAPVGVGHLRKGHRRVNMVEY